jgi:hypothetical protein
MIRSATGDEAVEVDRKGTFGSVRGAETQTETRRISKELGRLSCLPKRPESATLCWGLNLKEEKFPRKGDLIDPKSLDQDPE